MENVTISTFLENQTLVKTTTPNVKDIYRIRDTSTTHASVPLTTLIENYKAFNASAITTESSVNSVPQLNVSENVPDFYGGSTEQGFQTTTEAVILELAEDSNAAAVYDSFSFTEFPSGYNATDVTLNNFHNYANSPSTELLTVTNGSTEVFDYFETSRLPDYVNITDLQESFKPTELPDYLTLTELPKYSSDTNLPQSSIVTEISNYFTSPELITTEVPDYVNATEILDYYNVTKLPGYASATELSSYASATELSSYASATELSEKVSGTQTIQDFNETHLSKDLDLINLYSSTESSSLSYTSDISTVTETVKSSTGSSNIFRLKDPHSTTEFLSSFSWSNVTNWINNRSTPGSDYTTHAITTFFNGNGTIFDDGVSNISHDYNYSLPVYVPLDDILNTTMSGFTTAINDSRPLSVSHYTHGLEMVSILAILLILIIVTATTGNILVITTIITNPKMKTKTHLFLFNLAIADLIMALFVVPFALITLLEGRWVFGDVMCHLNGFLTGLSAHASCHLLMYISIHKCITLTSPYTEMSRGYVCAMMIAAWLWPVGYNFAMVLGWTEIVHKAGALQCGPVVPSSRSQILHSIVNTVCNEALPFFILLYCYARIFCYVSSTTRKVSSCLPDPEEKAARVQQQKQMVYTLLMILLCFLLCWTPYLIYSINIQQYAQNEVPTWLHILNPIAYLFGYMNSACNPIIYALRSSTFWESYKRILCPRKGNRRKMRKQENGHINNVKKQTPTSPRFNGVRPTIELVRDEKFTDATARDEEDELTEDFSLLSGNSNLQGSIERELWKRGLDLNFISENPNKIKKNKSRHHSRVADMFHRIKRRADKSSMSRCNSGEWSPTKTPYRSYESLEGEDPHTGRELKERRKSDANIGSAETELQAFGKLKKDGRGSSRMSLSRKGCSSRSRDSLSKEKHQNIPLQVWVLRDDEHV